MSISRSLILLALLGVTAAASAQTVIDGNFENTALGADSYVYAPGGTDWSYTYPSGLANGSSPWHYAAEDGSQYGFVQSASGVAGGITGSITGMTIGASYNLTFYLGSRLSYVIDPLDVLVGGTTIATGVAPIDDQTGTGWTKFSYSFVAASTNASLAFNGAAPLGGDLNTAIDNISVQAVPEPAPFAALGLGALGLLVRRRCTKRS